MSLDAQREELKSLASKNGLEIVATFEDAVVSGSTDDRPGFQDLTAAIRSRRFEYLLVYDTSRIARSILIAQVFKRECERYGVRIMYATTPVELDPITAVLFNAVYEAFDEIHSLMSRKKGLAGMRQNISKGWRAGGRAPMGYTLAHEPTGAMRDGRPVMKSKLKPDPEYAWLADYLKARAAGEPRTATLKRLGVTHVSSMTMVDVEWNALTYAGNTVWNRHREKKARGDGLPRRRPREEWIVQKNTHPALITELEAEAILAQLSTSSIAESMRQAKALTSDYLLSGLMFTSDGRPWIGAGTRYRVRAAEGGKRGRYVNRQEIEEAVINHVRERIADDRFMDTLAAVSREWYPENDPGRELEREARRFDREADRAAKLALETSEPQPFISLMEAKRRQAAALRAQAEAARRDERALKAIREISRETAREALGAEQDPSALIRSLVARIILEPDLTCTVHYLPQLDCSLSLASPRGSDIWTMAERVQFREKAA